MAINSPNNGDETSSRDLQDWLIDAEIRRDESLRLEGIVGEKFKRAQAAMTNRHNELIASMRVRLEEALVREGKKPPQNKERKLTIAQVQRILDNENVGEFEPGQCFNLPINTTR